MSTELEKVRKLALADKNFRDRLLANPAAAVMKAQISLSKAEMSTLQADIKRLTANKTITELDEIFKKNPLGW